MDLLLEHDSTPGLVYDENYLLYGSCGAILNEMELNESTDAIGAKVIKFKGKFQEADAVNKNKRSYPYTVLESNVKRLSETIGSGGLVGELDHPTDSIIHFANCSHKINKLWWEGKVLMGEGTILNTPAGKILRSILESGVRVGISSRGVGNGRVNEEGILVIGESYKLITFDAVADPSTHAAFQEKVVSSKQENVNSFRNIAVNAVKNETSGIHISNEMLVACMSGIINKHINEMKTRLN